MNHGYRPDLLSPVRYLDELPELPGAPLGLSILYLIRQSVREAPAQARALLARAKSEIQDSALQADLIELIETVILYKLPELNREEIQAMLQVHDIRQSRVYKEAVEEGIEKERQHSLEWKLRAIPILAARQMSAAEIADIVALDVELVRQHFPKSPS